MKRTHENGVGIVQVLMQIGATHHWPTYYTPLADLLHSIGRLIPHHWPTYYAPLADLLQTIGRLITHRWPTYYTPLADLLHAPWTHEATHCRDAAGSQGVPGNRRDILPTSSTDLGGAGGLMAWHGRLITCPAPAKVSQPQPRSASSSQGQPKSACVRG